MHKVHTQKGSAHVIVIAVLAVALAGTLGFVFYQNFIAKKAVVADSSNQSSDGVTQNSTSQTTETKTVTAKEFCTELEKICFNYPDDWIVSADKDMGTLSESLPSMDKVQIKNKSGETYLYVTTGISGIGGTCVPEENTNADILETHTTGIRGDYLRMDSSDYESTAYAVKYVSQTYGDHTKYTIGMHIANASEVIMPGTVNNCTLGYKMFVSKFDKGEVQFSTSGFAVEASERTFGSRSEAVKFLNSDDAKTAYDILKSAHYN